MQTKTHIFFLSMFLMPLFGHAQPSLSFYHTDELLHTSSFNPAFFSSNEKYTFSIFPLAGGSMSLNDQQALSQVSDLLFFDKISDVLKNIFKTMVNKKLYYQHGEMAFLNLGYHGKNGSFNFVVKDQAWLMLDFEGELSKFLMNTDNFNVTLNRVQSFPAEAIHYREYSLGYSNEIIEKQLSIGFRAKLLYGKFFLSSDASATTVGNNSDYSVVSTGSINMSIPADRIENQDEEFIKLDPFANQTILDYFTNTGNPGFAFDLGNELPRGRAHEVSKKSQLTLMHLFVFFLLSL